MKKETISTSECFAIWAGIFIIIVGIVESFSFVVFRPSSEETDLSTNKIPVLVMELYRIFAYFLMGGIFNVLIVEMSKYTVGRLRPHFFELCEPQCNGSPCCQGSNSSTLHKYIEIYECKNPSEVREARVSFLSGHSSFSFYRCEILMIFL